MQETPPAKLPNAALLHAVAHHVSAGRHALVHLLVCLHQVEKRHLHAEKGFGSMFAYVRHLGFSEGESWRRVAAARVVGAFPEALHRLVQGTLSLTTVSMLRGHINETNCVGLLEEVAGLGKAEVEAVLARRGAATAKPASRLQPVRVRQNTVESTAASPRCLDDAPLLRLAAKPRGAIGGVMDPVGCDTRRGAHCPGAAEETPVDAKAHPHPSTAAPAPDPAGCMYKLQVTLTTESRAALQRAQGLLRHRLPHGDYNDIVALALQELVAKLERNKACTLKKPAPSLAAAQARVAGTSDAPVPRPVAPQARMVAADTGLNHSANKMLHLPTVSQPAVLQSAAPVSSAPGIKRSRAIPRSVKRLVYARDGGCCAYIANDGRRCGGRAFIEYHHAEPFARGGAHTVDNIELRCRLHNQYEAIVVFGPGGGRRAGTEGGALSAAPQTWFGGTLT